jgi:hypothetical protein
MHCVTDHYVTKMSHAMGSSQINPHNHTSPHKKNYLQLFFVLLTMCLYILCNENQLVALFIFNLFHQSTSTGFRHVCCPSSGSIHSVCVCVCACVCRHTQQLVGVKSLSWLAAGWDRTLNWPAANQLKHVTCTACCTYPENTSWWWATNMPETCRGWLMV